MDRAVVFTSNNARIITGHMDSLTRIKGAIINPDLTAVNGIPPHYWKVIPGGIIAMTSDEKLERDKLHPISSVDNRLGIVPAVERKFPWRFIWLTAGMFFTLGFLVGVVLK